MSRSILRLLAAASLLSPALVFAGDWGAFRGPNRTGISGETHVPQTWDASKNVRWKAPLPGPGNSSPIVVGTRVFVTCATDQGRHRGLYCFDRSTGQANWSKIVDYADDDPTHMTNPYCGSSPAADVSYVVVWHGSAGVHCYDHQGRAIWSRDLGKFRHIWGYGSSPVIYGAKVLLNCGPGARQFVTALDLATGKTLWQRDEPGGDSGEEDKKDAEADAKPLWVGSWSTPVVARIDGRPQVLVSLSHHVNAYDLETGEVLWTVDGMGDLAYTDVLVGNGIGVAMGGYHGPAIGFKLGGSGNVTATNRLWQNTSRNPQRIGSGVIVGDYVYMANEIGLAQCLELKTGREVWKDRLPGAKIWSSIIAAEDRLYVTNQEGTTYVFAPNPEKLEVLHVNQLGEPNNSTLAISNGQIFLRSFEHLVCIDESADPRR
jgi:outer membrane protein assembly factor BamB